MKTIKLIAFTALIGLVVAACGGGESAPSTSGGPAGPGDIAHGSEIYKGTCATCHGGDAKGIDGLGRSLVNNEFIQSMSEQDLATFIKVGRDRDDPDNTTGVDMPPKGGNPSLTEQDLNDVSAYLKSLNP